MTALKIIHANFNFYSIKDNFNIPIQVTPNSLANLKVLA